MRPIKDHLKQSEAYRNSYMAASDYIDSSMKLYAPAIASLDLALQIENRILEYQLLASDICPTASTKKLLTETACRIIPYGRVTAMAREYRDSQYYIVLDSGVIDFLSNLGCLHFAIFEQNNKLYDYDFNEQAILTKLFQLGLIYFDYGLSTNNENLVYPHFHLKYLQENTRIHAYNLSAKAEAFFVLHEIGHIVDIQENTELDDAEREYSADFFALTAIRSIAASSRNTADLEMAIIGCLLAVLSINFIQKTFPNLEYVRNSRALRFPNNSRYPDSDARLERLWRLMPPQAMLHFKNHPLVKSIIDTYEKYSKLIIEGKRPSQEYWDLMETMLRSHNDTAEKWNDKHSFILRKYLNDEFKNNLTWQINSDANSATLH